MKRKIFVGTIIASLAATSVFAAGSYCDYSNKSYKAEKNGHGYHKMTKQHRGFKIQKMISALNLTPAQQAQIDVVIKKHANNKTKISDAFSKTGFDKQKFIELATNKRENMIKSRADMIEGIYKVLNDEQKLQLKVLMDIKMNKMSKMRDMHKMMNKGNHFDKHSYGRG